MTALLTQLKLLLLLLSLQRKMAMCNVYYYGAHLIIAAVMACWLVAETATAAPPTPLLCTTRQGIVAAQPGLLCAECQFVGYLDPNANQCAYDLQTLATTASAYIPSNCSSEYNECAVDEDGRCVPSRYGTLCNECSGQGYLVPTDDLRGRRCVCYAGQLDPKLACRPGQFFQVNQSRTIQLQRTFTKLSCVSHQHPMLGCFEQIDSSGHKYGTKDPPVPYRCCGDIYGPPPGELREKFTLGNPFEECNTYGGPDPNLVPLNDTSFRTCNGHGLFNFTARACQCDREWAEEPIGRDLDDNVVMGCTTCTEFYGPSPKDPFKLPPFCISLHSPDPLTGREEECGGHGRYYPETRECVCFGNRTHGYWDQGVIGNWPDGGGLVKSCVTCQPGYSIEANCTAP